MQNDETLPWSPPYAPIDDPKAFLVLMKLSDEVETPAYERVPPTLKTKKKSIVPAGVGERCPLGDDCNEKASSLTRQYGCICCGKYVHEKCCYELNKEDESYMTPANINPFQLRNPSQKVICHFCDKNHYLPGWECLESKDGGSCTLQTMRISIHHQCARCHVLVHPKCAQTYVPWVDNQRMQEAWDHSTCGTRWKNQPVCVTCFEEVNRVPTFVDTKGNEINDLSEDPFFPEMN